MDPVEQSGLLDYARILWRRKLTILIVVVVAVAATVGLDSVRTKRYTGTARLLFVSQSYSSVGAVTPLSPTDIATDIGLVQSSTVKAIVAKSLKTAPPPVSVAEQGTTEIATVSVTSTDPAFAAKAANAYAKGYIQASQQRFLNTSQAAENQLQGQINALQNQINGLQNQINQANSKDTSTLSNLDNQLGALASQQNTLRAQLSQIQVNVAQSPSGGQLVEPATQSNSPVSPKRVTDALIALVIGLIVGIAVALLRETLDDRIRTKAELERVAGGLPSLGLIPVVGEWHDRKKPFLISALHPRSPPAEAYRGLRTSIQFISLDKAIKTLQVTSPAAADGKTTTSANLAVTMAEAGKNVVLVGCDLRRPRIHDFFGLSNNVGFTSILVGDVSLEDALQSVPDHKNLTVLPSGPIPPNPSELLGSAKAREVIARLAQAADVVILDSAPVLPVTDAAVLARQVDAILLVAKSGSTTQKDITRSVEVLTRVDAPLAGLVLNGASEADCYVYYRYGDQYGYGYRTRAEPRGGSQSNGNGQMASTGGAEPRSDVAPDFSREPDQSSAANGAVEKIVRDA
ncbi:MAG TPA: polysaccharide biosynthesis tyrosine autokinase [Acidimicrobiales bacterium]|nr:polysaccharide biosynthesis tyrosine autokinase [Acidimicrobiales bacterium]